MDDAYLGGERAGTDHLLRQALARLAIAAGAHAPGIHPGQQPSNDRFIHRVLTGPIRTHDLPQKHRQCHRRRELAFPVFRQLCLNHSQHPRIGEQVEKMVGIDFLSTLGKATLLLGRSTVKVVSHEGWPRGGWGGCLVTNILTNPDPTFFFAFNKLAHNDCIAWA